MRCLLPLASLSLPVASGLTAGVGLAGLFMLGGVARCRCRPQTWDRLEYV
jgi:hypothetical protein